MLFAACQTVQVLFVASMKLFGSPAQLVRTEEAFAGTAAWAASLEAVLMAQGVVLSSLCTDGTEVGERAAGTDGLGSSQAAAG